MKIKKLLLLLPFTTARFSVMDPLFLLSRERAALPWWEALELLQRHLISPLVNYCQNFSCLWPYKVSDACLGLLALQNVS